MLEDYAEQRGCAADAKFEKTASAARLEIELYRASLDRSIFDLACANSLNSTIKDSAAKCKP